MKENTIVRTQNNAVVNVDKSEYLAAKQRREKILEQKQNSCLLERLNNRVTDIENCLKSLQVKIEKMEQQ